MNKSEYGMFSRFFMHSRDMLCVMDNELRFEILNPIWLKNLGYETLDLKEEKFIDYVHPDDAKDNLEKIKSLKTAEQVVEFKNRFKHKSGSYKSLKWLVFQEDNKLYALLQDITEQDVPDPLINREEVLFQSLIQNMVGALSLHKVEKDPKNETLHYKFVDVNQAYEKLIGTRKEQLIGKSLLEVYPDTENVWLETLNKVYQTGKPLTVEDHAKEINMYVELTVFKPREDLIAMIGTDITERKQVENDLQFSRQMLRNVLDNIPISMYWKDANSVYLGCNKNFVKDTLAHSIDEVIGKTDFELCPNKEDAETFRADDLMVISTKKEKINSEESFTRDNKTYWRSSSKVPLFNDKNEVFGVLGAYTDITEQKEAEYELIKEKERAEDNEFFLKESQRIGNIGSYKLDMATGVFQLDEILDKMFGVESLPVKNLEEWFALIHPEDQEMLFNYFNNEVIAKKQIFDKEYRILTYDKKVLKWIYSIGNIYMDEAGNVAHMQGTVQDITERKKIEHETLKAKANSEKNEKRYEGLLNNLSAGIIVHAPDTTILHNNALACTILGLTDEQLKQKDASDPYWQFYDSENNTLTFENLPVNIISHTKKPLINFIAGVYRPSLDNKVWLEINGYPLLNSASEITEIVISLFDITERYLITEERKQMNKKLENQVKERTAQLVQANKDLESFAYSVSHDLRAPIRHVDGFVHLLKNSLPSDNDKVNNYIHKITASSKNMSTMIDELLQFSKLGRSDITSKKVDLNSCIQNIIAQFKPDYESRNIKWDIKKLPDVYGEPALLKLVFENLISNAIKYTSKREEAMIEIGQVEKSEPDKAGIYVKDNGAGFDMAYKDKLFGVFQRLHKKEEFDGVGIGLANAKQIIKKHDGEIYAESELNKGATFFITLPINKH